MTFLIVQGDANHIPLRDESVQCVVTSPLAQVLTINVGLAMHPTAALSAQGNVITHGKPQFRVASPRANVVRVYASGPGLRLATTHASVAITRIDSAQYIAANTPGIEALTLWRTTVFVVRVGGTRLAAHTISLAAQVRSWVASLLTEYRPRLCRMLVPSKGIGASGITHVVVFAGKVLAAGPSRNAITNQPVIDALGITANHLANVIRTKVLNKVLLTKPPLVRRLLSALPCGFARNRTEPGRLASASCKGSPALLA